jgi:hypothetical protein
MKSEQFSSRLVCSNHDQEEEVEMIIEAINAVRRIRVYPLVGSKGSSCLSLLRNGGSGKWEQAIKSG